MQNSYKPFNPQNMYRPGGSALPEVVKNLLIINGLFFVAQYVIEMRYNINLVQYLGLHFPMASNFKVWQPITYMFLHGSFTHILFNMLALWMFGTPLENAWGSKRFLIFYIITGVGASILHLLTQYFLEFQTILNNPLIPDQLKDMVLNNMVTIGASGAVYGLLLGFAMLFPNQLIYLYFFVPIKAKYLVPMMVILEVYLGYKNTVGSGDNVAHFAHLGGMLIGFIIIKYWNKTNRNNMY